MSQTPPDVSADSPAAGGATDVAGGRSFLRRQLRQLTKAPFTLAFIAVLWILGAATGSLLHGPQGRFDSWAGAGLANLTNGHLTSLPASALFASNLANYLVATVLLLAVGLVERRIGTLSTAVLAVTMQVLGVLLGIALVALSDPFAEAWSDTLSDKLAVTPLPMVLGVLAAYSGRLSAYWRRRLRLVAFAVMLTFVLYGGYLEDVLTFGGLIVGLLTGPLLGRLFAAGPRDRALAPLRLPLRSTRRETRTLVATIVAVTALGPLLVAVSPSAVGPLRVLRYLFVTPTDDTASIRAVCRSGDQQTCADLVLQHRFHGLGPSMLAIMPAVLVLVLAWGLYRGRRSAWMLSLAVQVVLLVFGVRLLVTALSHRPGTFGALALANIEGSGGLVLPILQPVLVIGLLVLTRSAFALRPPAGTHRRLWQAFAAWLVIVLAVYLVVGSMTSDHMALTTRRGAHPNFSELLRQFPLRVVPPGYLGLGTPQLIPSGWPATVLVEWTGVLIWAGAIIAVLVGYRGLRIATEGEQAARARAILTSSGGGPLSYLTTWEGNDYWFSSTGKSYVAYRAHGGVALTTGDPVGPETDRTLTLREFAAFCEENGWIPCLYSVGSQTRAITSGFGWAYVQVAEETSLDLATLAFKGRKFQDIRTAVNRAARDGITTTWTTYRQAQLVITEQIRAMSEEWVADKGLPEMGFTLGGIDELDDPHVRLLVATGADGRLHGVTSWLPVYRDEQVIGWTLDFMRRPGDAFPGVMEFLIGTAALQFQAEGARFCSLSGAPLARTEPVTDQAAPLERLLNWLGTTMEPVYGFRSLLAFKSKFQPVYSPMYMCFPDSAALPRIAAAIGHAYVPSLTVKQMVQIAGKL